MTLTPELGIDGRYVYAKTRVCSAVGAYICLYIGRIIGGIVGDGVDISTSSSSIFPSTRTIF